LSQPNPQSDAERLAALPRLPRDEEGPVFAEPWQAQAFALAVKLSEQGHVLRSTTKGLVVGGSTPAATLWAASELAYHFGVNHAAVVVHHGEIVSRAPHPAM